MTADVTTGGRENGRTARLCGRGERAQRVERQRTEWGPRALKNDGRMGERRFGADYLRWPATVQLLDQRP